jgi:predicted amidohydrolase
MRSVRLATVSFLIEDAAHSIDQNITKSREYIRQAAKAGADIVCLPETVTTLNVRAGQGGKISPEEIQQRSDEWQNTYREFAREFSVYLIAPMYAIDDGSVRNRAFLFGPDGSEVGHYDKVQPTGAEPFVTPGESFPIFDLPFGRIGIMVCMDIYFPEIARIYAMKGVEVLFWPTITHGPTQVGLESQLRSRAIDNSLHIVEANLAGRPPYAPYMGRFYPGNAKVMDFNGDIIASTGRQHGVVVAEIDLDQQRKTSHVFLLSEPDNTRADLEQLVRMNLYAQEYAAISNDRTSTQNE